MQNLLRGGSIWLASVSSAALLLAGHISAVPLASAAPPSPSWTGCYVGGQIGRAWSSQGEVSETFGSRLANPALNTSIETSGGLFGGQVGCDTQAASNFVVGVQGDLDASTVSGSGFDPFGGLFLPIDVRTDWLASATGRLGVTSPDNRTLFYAKGGAAWEHDRWSWNAPGLAFANGTTAPTITDTRNGWVAGGGIEQMLTPSWRVFAEFDYYQFGHGGTFVDQFPNYPAGTIYQAGRQNVEAVKVGANLKLFGN
ncbi:MAG: outer membrane beta-barrel protein [Xanthobacteraceae bacterium]|nr:outer membrane beta-barrel protein [Xanthobacteraceae bacterium]